MEITDRTESLYDMKESVRLEELYDEQETELQAELESEEWAGFGRPPLFEELGA